LGYVKRGNGEETGAPLKNGVLIQRGRKRKERVPTDKSKRLLDRKPIENEVGWTR